jgi:hypothetical protein
VIVAVIVLQVHKVLQVLQVLLEVLKVYVATHLQGLYFLLTKMV